MDRGFEAVILRDGTATTTLVLRGELDLGAAVAANQAVDRALDDRANAYVLDLADLQYLNAAGISPLVRLAVTARRAGARVSARRVRHLAAVVLQMTPIELDDGPPGRPTPQPPERSGPAPRPHRQPPRAPAAPAVRSGT
ncbi:MAG TPA: STAS domain-containing protein [Acidimicrobiales bacterium]|nr:STAS domain-containing protein [Acidimicrobiales bacterium]